MRRIFSSHSLNVFQLKLDHWPYDTHTHNFFELILVNTGSGIHQINDSSFPYHKGDVFLLTPEDHHSFKIGEPTVFTYIKFTEQIFHEKPEWKNNKWTEEVLQVLYKPNTIPESIIKDKEEKFMTFQLAEMLLKEYISNIPYSRQLLLELFGAIVVVVVRNLSERDVDSSGTENRDKQKFNKILAYIRQNIDQREKITTHHIAETFNLSPNYVSAYIQKYTGCGLQKIINETRLTTAQRLLKESPLSINEIAEKVGFSDASHMNKMFQKYNGINPSDLR